MKKLIYIAAAAMSMAAGLQAQQIDCSFDDGAAYSLSTFDTWADSPFTTGVLDGQIMLADNPSPDGTNGTARAVAFHRSPYGSHLYGARIGLGTPVPMSDTPRYLHVMLLKPAGGDAALVVLGKRADRSGQSPETVQAVTRSLNEAQAGRWSDIVFELRGNHNAEIHSLVIAPDTERHPAGHDSYTAYIDEIVLNDDPRPRDVAEPYRLAFAPDMTVPGVAMPLTALTFTVGGATGSIAVPDSLNAPVYVDMTATPAFAAMPGEKVTMTIDGGTERFACTLFADWDNDGQFAEAGGGASPSGECVASIPSAASGGRDVTGRLSFAIPDGTEPGIYRLRCKVYDKFSSRVSPLDATDVDAQSGGKIIDMTCNVHTANVRVAFVARMCDVTSPGGGPAPSQAEFGKDLKFDVRMDSDYRITGLEVKHGHDLGGPEMVNGNRRWRTDVMPLDSDGTVTIPARMVDGDVSVTIMFVNR